MEELAESQAKYMRRKLSKTNPKFPKTTDKEKNVRTTGQRHRTYIEEQRPGCESSLGRSGVRGPISSRKTSILEFCTHKVFPKKQNETKCLSSLQKSNKFVTTLLGMERENVLAVCETDRKVVPGNGCMTFDSVVKVSGMSFRKVDLGLLGS